VIPVRQIFRLLHINRILVRHGLDEIIFATHLFRPFRFFLFMLPWNWLPRKRLPRAQRLRQSLEDLGPIFIKFGQILSTRRDLLPDDIADELARLQDNVAPFPGFQARRIIEQTYGKSINEVFEQFDETPLASASIAQVHVARLLDGREVVVKVVRPNIRKIIERDVALLYVLADLAERYWSQGKRLRPRAVVTEYEKTILDELDLSREAANASQLRRNFSGSDMLYVPEIYWPWTQRNVLVMERIHGTPISDIDELRKQDVDLKKLSETGVEIFFTQVFRHNFFHADMHPGNIFVSAKGQYIAVDFGIMGTLSPDDQRYLAENFLAFFNRDYHRVAELHVQSGWVPAGTRIDEFESAIRSVCEPMFERPLKEISFGRLLLYLFHTARRFNMEIQPQLVLLQKTLLNIEGLGRQLYPDLDLWQTAKPFLERWMNDNIGWRGFTTSMRKESLQWLETLPQLPNLVHGALKQISQGGLKIEGYEKELQRIQYSIKQSNQRTVRAIIGSSLIVSAALSMDMAVVAGMSFAGISLASWILAVAGVAMLMSIWTLRHDG
jgi:ubiquinone biosynthesis protein